MICGFVGCMPFVHEPLNMLVGTNAVPTLQDLSIDVRSNRALCQETGRIILFGTIVNHGTGIIVIFSAVCHFGHPIYIPLAPAAVIKSIIFSGDEPGIGEVVVLNHLLEAFGNHVSGRRGSRQEDILAPRTFLKDDPVLPATRAAGTAIGAFD